MTGHRRYPATRVRRALPLDARPGLQFDAHRAWQHNYLHRMRREGQNRLYRRSKIETKERVVELFHRGPFTDFAERSKDHRRVQAFSKTMTPSYLRGIADATIAHVDIKKKTSKSTSQSLPTPPVSPARISTVSSDPPPAVRVVVVAKSYPTCFENSRKPTYPPLPHSRVRTTSSASSVTQRKPIEQIVSSRYFLRSRKRLARA